MKIWLINHYGVPPQYYPLARPTLFAKHLIALGHDVTIIAASTAHNSNINLIEDDESYRKEIVNGVPYVYVKCTSYKGNGIKRMINIIEFAWKLPYICNKMDKPDVIVATSFDPFTCLQGIRYAKAHDIKAIAEIADLWPETMIVHNWATENNPGVKFLRYIEKKIYTLADAIIFTFEGAYDYIIEKGLDTKIPRTKVFYINNGIDLTLFNHEKAEFITHDADLDNEEIFKVVYAGAIRTANNVGTLLDTAKCITDPSIRFLIWGDGDELPSLKKRLQNENINNVVFKGRVPKKYIPYITSKADLNVAIGGKNSSLYRFGISFNKIFDYLAAGKPILCGFYAKYNPVLQCHAGVAVETEKAEDIAKEILNFAKMEKKQYEDYCINAQNGVIEYDFKEHTKRLLNVIDNI